MNVNIMDGGRLVSETASYVCYSAAAKFFGDVEPNAPSQHTNITAESSNERTAPSSKVCRLLDLPRELRDMIYKATFACIVVIDSAPDTPTINTIEEACKAASALPRTCEQISRECDGMFTVSCSIRQDNAALRQWHPLAIGSLLALSCSFSARNGRRRGMRGMCDKKHHWNADVDTQNNIWANFTRREFNQPPKGKEHFDFKLEAGSVARFSLVVDDQCDIVNFIDTGLTSDGRPAHLSDLDIRRLRSLICEMRSYLESTWEVMHTVLEEWARRP